MQNGIILAVITKRVRGIFISWPCNLSWGRRATIKKWYSSGGPSLSAQAVLRVLVAALQTNGCHYRHTQNSLSTEASLICFIWVLYLYIIYWEQFVETD